jgi:hypothetical protein
MTCDQCGTLWCNRCGKDIGDVGYAHFTIEGCPLYDEAPGPREVANDENIAFNMRQEGVQGQCGCIGCTRRRELERERQADEARRALLEREQEAHAAMA